MTEHIIVNQENYEEILKKLEEIKSTVLVLDIETSGKYPDTGEEINIATNFEDYVKYAKTKWFGGYSYKHDKLIADLVSGNEDSIKNFIAEHDYIVGFNNEEFDTPILANNDLMPEGYKKQLDCLIILGSSSYKRHDGLPFKNRGQYMGFKFKKNSLKHMAEVMGLETQKGDIDYRIFHKDFYTDEEVAEIKKYLEADVMATKQMFDKLWEFYLPFTKFLTEADILNLSWIKSSIASLTYKAACKVLGVEDTYGDKPESSKEEMGGRVIEPLYEEARKVWYVDFTSLYPHMFCQFNLFNEVKEELTDYELDQGLVDGSIWHGNEMFQVKGYYWANEQHPLSKDIADKLKLRLEIKKQIKETGVPNSLEYAIKIFLNSLYGAARSPIFEQIHTPNCGWDCCWLGQQIQMYTEKRMADFGFETIAGDTDSIFVVANEDSNSNKEYVKSCLKTIVDEIKANVPFPAETYDIDIEAYLDYVMWPFSEQPIEWDGEEEPLADFLLQHGFMAKESLAIAVHNKENVQIGHNVKNLKNRLIKINRGKKKNYLYIYEKKGEKTIKIMGLPIKKDGATLLGPKLYEEVLKPLILENDRAKFPKEFIDNLLTDALKKSENLVLLAREYKVKPLVSYKNENQIQAQISAGYFNGQEGVISLIKNKKVGNAGKTAKYATVEEIIENNVSLKDLDLEKIYNELEPFVDNETRK